MVAKVGLEERSNHAFFNGETPKLIGESQEKGGDKYGHARRSKGGKPGVKDARKKFAPNADKPTTASADPSKKLPETVKKVDPQAISAVLQNIDRKSTRLNSSHVSESRMPSSA